jgi:DNA-binding NtrC family response regulator
MSEGDEISLEDLSLPITSKRKSAMGSAGMQPVPVIAPDTSQAPSDSGAEELSLEDYFQRFVLENQDAMNETELAQKLGISRKCLWERRQRFDLPRKRKRGAA